MIDLPKLSREFDAPRCRCGLHARDHLVVDSLGWFYGGGAREGSTCRAYHPSDRQSGEAA